MSAFIIEAADVSGGCCEVGVIIRVDQVVIGDCGFCGD